MINDCFPCGTLWDAARMTDRLVRRLGLPAAAPMVVSWTMIHEYSWTGLAGQPRVEDPKCYPDPTARQPDAVGFNTSPRVGNGAKIARYADTKRRQAHDARGAHGAAYRPS